VEFGDRVKEHAEALLELIRKQEKINKQFIAAFGNFWELCKKSINPNLSAKAVEEMVTVQGVIKKMSYMELDGITMNKQL
jgi:hypothetical protein